MERTRTTTYPSMSAKSIRRRWFNGVSRHHFGWRTPLHVFERGSVSGVRYRDEVLEPYVRLFRGVCGPRFILMDD
ncbi:DDE_3 domain-containing protein [Trichonephila clavipes]|nr:DDE_3 domain-containing protein [Trichonephila clavipes]